MDIGASFGAWLKRRRKALDLTQEALAAQVGCSVATIQKIESDERRPSRQIADLLAQQLAIPPDERATFTKVARGELRVTRLAEAAPTVLVTASPTAPPSINNLPMPPTPLIGREVELAALARLLSDPHCRLLTLVGPGGIGKSRLAIAAAAISREQFRDGVCWVPLAPLSSPEFIVSAMSAALSLSFSASGDPRTQLVTYLRCRHLLLIIDNAEHLLADISLLVDVLEQAPGVKLLVTSREVLNLRGEWVFDVQGLPVPDNGRCDEAMDSSAVTLFVQRARQLKTDFQLSPENQPWVARICQAVQGLPLGLELAATWIRSLTVQEIAQEIERDLRFLSTATRDLPERHRSLRAVFDHSWCLLAEEERRAVRRLSVCRGGFDREAAQAIAAADLSLLSALMAKSLLRRTATGRYDYHELVRQYAHEKLAEAGEIDQACDQHLAFFMDLAEEAEPKLHGAEQAAWFARLEVDHDNVRAALAWSQTAPQRGGQGLRLSIALVFFWTVHGYFQEGQTWLERGLAQADAIDESLRAKALSGIGTMAWCRGDYDTAIRFHQASLESYRLLGDQHGIAQALQNLGVQAFHQFRYEEAAALVHASLKLRRDLGDRPGIANALISLGVAARKQNDLAQSIQHYEEALSLYRELSDTRWIAGTLLNMGIAVFEQGDYRRARQLHRESLPLFVELGDRQALPESLGGLAEVHWVLGQPQRAAQLFGAIEALREATDVPLAEVYRPAHLRLLDDIRAHLGADAFAAAWTRGRAMTLEQAVALALDEEPAA